MPSQAGGPCAAPWPSAVRGHVPDCTPGGPAARMGPWPCGPGSSDHADPAPPSAAPQNGGGAGRRRPWPTLGTVRALFAISLGVHIIFAPLGVGLPLMIALAEIRLRARPVRSRQPAPHPAGPARGPDRLRLRPAQPRAHRRDGPVGAAAARADGGGAAGLRGRVRARLFVRAAAGGADIFDLAALFSSPTHTRTSCSGSRPGSSSRRRSWRITPARRRARPAMPRSGSRPSGRGRSPSQWPWRPCSSCPRRAGCRPVWPASGPGSWGRWRRFSGRAGRSPGPTRGPRRRAGRAGPCCWPPCSSPLP